MKINRFDFFLYTICLFWLSAALTACNPTTTDEITPSIDATQAYQTVEAKLTRVVAQTPTKTHTPVPTESGLDTPTPTAGPTETPSPTATITPTDVPCDRARFITDVSIPDETKMNPGERFTKTWRLRNDGSCPWTKDYSAVWFSGEMLGSPSSVPLSGIVNPGQVVDITVDMVAPGKQGTYQSNWKLRNTSGLLFGIGPNGDFPFWVSIVVVEQPTETPTPTPEPTSTPTLTPTPNVQVRGQATLNQDDLIDLDTNQINTENSQDLLFHVNENGNPLLTPQGSALHGLFGNSQPSLQACQSANLSSASLPVDNIPVGTYLCYLTDLGLYGWAQLIGFNNQDFTLNLDILTWAQPEEIP